MGHSQSGPFPLAAALLDPDGGKGLVLVEPGGCPAKYTAEQIKTLATVPILVVFGDHRDTPTGIATRPSWQSPSRAVRRSSAASRRPAVRRRCSARRTAASAATAT